MKLEPHNTIAFNDGDYLWKYIDINKFIYFISEKKIYFTRLDNLDDPLEGLTDLVLGNLAAYESIPKKVEDLNPLLTTEAKKHIINVQGERKRSVDISTINSQTTQFASCWFLGEKESFAMWKLYSNEDSVAIRYKPSDLLMVVKAAAESYVSEDFQIFLYGKVIYKNVWPFNFFKDDGPKVKYNAFKKDSSYAHENEYRFVVVSPPNKVATFPNFELYLGDISKDDVKIFANPFMQDWKYANLKKILSAFSPNTELCRSNLRVK